jgi:hypothetical protein
MSLSTHTSGLGLWGLLMFIALGCCLTFAAIAFAYTRRLLRLGAIPGTDDLNGYQKALRKLRKDEPMTQDEINLTERILDVRRSPMAFAVPLAFMFVGIFYVFGSLEYLHGHTPSERTFLGFIPMFTSTNLIIQIAKSRGLYRKLKKRRPAEVEAPTAPQPVGAP